MGRRLLPGFQVRLLEGYYTATAAGVVRPTAAQPIVIWTSRK
jgi:hypothetical protein